MQRPDQSIDIDRICKAWALRNAGPALLHAAVLALRLLDSPEAAMFCEANEEKAATVIEALHEGLRIAGDY